MDVTNDNHLYSTYEEEGRDEASDYAYLVSATVTETADSALLRKNGLQFRFKYNFLAGANPPTARYTIDLSDEISKRLRIPLGRLLKCYGVPSAARKHTVGLLFELYGCWPNTPPWWREPIQASFEFKAYNYVSDPHQDGFGDDTFIYLGEVRSELDRVMVMTSLVADYSSRPTPVSRDAVEALEKVTVRAGDMGETSCAVCLEGFVFGSEATKMPCSHVFHGDCIVRWLENRYVCPVCRFELPSAS